MSSPRCAAAAPPSTAEKIAEAEEIAEDVAEIGERVRTVAARRDSLQTGVAVAVVRRALLGVAQDAIGFGSFLESLLGVRVLGIAVGMVLQREPAVSALDLLLAGFSAHTKNLVIISLRHGIHCVTA
jgi:hypothetical protein